MKTAYICTPFRGETERNKLYARLITLWAIKQGYAPITPHLYLTECLDDDVPRQRNIGMSVGQALLEKCDVLLCGTRYGISEGMTEELRLAKKLKIKIIEVDL